MNKKGKEKNERREEENEKGFEDQDHA